jgi:hypothetical protein
MQSVIARSALLGIALVVSQGAQAQYKCKQADGKIAYQQSPCAEGASAQKLDLTPSSGPATTSGERQSDWSAIARGEPKVGMTVKDLEQALGKPSRVNLAQYGPNTDDQLIYYRGNRTLYVYVRNGVVASIQNTEGGEIKVDSPSPKPCLTPQQIRELEFEASRIVNRGNAGMHDALAKARACR